MEIVSKNDIKKLPSDMASISPMAVEIKLSGVAGNTFNLTQLREILESRAATLRLGMT